MNNSNLSATKSGVAETKSILEMNDLFEKIKKATSDLAGESGDIGSENALNTLSLRL